jgi:hypothetical protein
MRRQLLWLFLVGLLGLAAVSGAISGNSAASTLTWGHAIQVPGTETASTATVDSISCPAAGTCAAGGQVATAHGASAFVIDETKGNWGTSMRVRGISAGISYTTSISCATAGNCTAVGSAGNSVFVVDEKHGSWGKAIKVPGLATLSSGGGGFLYSVSCATPGNCVAGGEYANDSDGGAFVVDETNGTWGTATPVQGIDTLGGGEGVVESVSCSTAGNCAAAGFYSGPSDSVAFVVDETNGTWGDAIDVPGAAALSGGTGDTAVNSISCATPGNCAAGGLYVDGDTLQTFLVDETNGTWGTAIEVPGTATLNTGGRAELNSISCATAGNCTAGGSYTDGADFESGHEHAFLVDETNGVWGTATEVPGTAKLSGGIAAEVDSVSCPTAGNCSAAGIYGNNSGANVFAVDETNASWGKAITIHDTGAYPSVNSISCGAPRVCLLGGYADGKRQQKAFVAGSGTRALTVPSAPHLRSAVPGNGKITATWRKPANRGGVPIAGYRVTAKAGSHVHTCSTTSKLHCTIGGLKNGTTYTVSVVALNTVGRSRPSNSKPAQPRE